MIAVVDYGAGNVRSVVHALEAIAVPCNLTTNPEEIMNADGVIVPGVGAARDTMRNLEARQLIAPIQETIASETPLLGICMGMQVLMTMSEEDGGQQCLDVIPGRVKRFASGVHIPHMGWNQVWRADQHRDHPLFREIPDGAEFYFAHSYYCEPRDQARALAMTEYGEWFTCSVCSDNVLGAQFHPEKSGRWGIQLLANFAAIAAAGGVEPMHERDASVAS